MVKINMAVTVDTVEELIEALKSAGPNVATFYGEVKGLNAADVSPLINPTIEEIKQELTSAEPEAPAREPEPVYTMVQVREALAKVRDIRGGDHMREILRKYGADKLAGVNPDQYTALMADLNIALEKDDAC